MKATWICTTWKNRTAATNSAALPVKVDSGVEMQAVNLHPAIDFQTIDGFGGALTEAAAYTFAQMNAADKERFLAAYFGSKGARYRVVRMALDSCDFALGNYSAAEDEQDDGLATFSLARDEQYILPLLRAAEGYLGGKLEIMLTPWSPPAYMKTNGQKNGGGKLKPEYRERWARYICRYVAAYRELGFRVTMLSIQNEPKAVQTWDSCIFTGEEEMVFLRDYLYPAMAKQRLEDLEVLVWDHNKERVVERAGEVITPDTDHMVAGIAFHWYSGDHFEELELFRRQYPGKKLVFTEGCVEYSRFGADDQLTNARMYAHDIIGNLNAGMNLSFDWNLLLDETGGPNHVGNFCDAPMMYNTKTGMLEQKLSLTYIGHISRYMEPGAVRIGLSRYTDAIDAAAWRNPDGTVGVVLMNRKADPAPVNLRVCGQVVEMELPGDAIATVLLENL